MVGSTILPVIETSTNTCNDGLQIIWLCEEGDMITEFVRCLCFRRLARSKNDVLKDHEATVLQVIREHCPRQEFILHD
jgi:hypothetical protein